MGWVGLCGCCVWVCGGVGLGFVGVVCLVVFVFCLWVRWSGWLVPRCVCLRVLCGCFPFVVVASSE